MTGVVWWTFDGGKRKCHNRNCGTQNIKTKSHKFANVLWNMAPCVFLVFVFLFVTVSGQHHHRHHLSPRRPTGTPAMEAYRNRWMAYLKAQASSTTTIRPPPLKSSVGVRGGTDGQPLVINGFQCERTYSFFPNRENSRMYHLCARSRDSWFVYHYFCPHGSLFSDQMGKCMQEQRDVSGQPGSVSNSGGINSLSSNNRRRPTRRTTVAPPYILRRTTTRPTTTISTTIPTTTTPPSTTTSTTTEATTSTTEEPIPEPDSDHSQGVTEADHIVASSSSEEFSTEDAAKEIDFNVSIPGFEESSEQQNQPSSDEVDEEQTSNQENEASDEVNMIIPEESVNGPSRLVGASTTTPSSLAKAGKQQTPSSKPLKRVPVKAMKTAESSDESVVANSSSSDAVDATALGGRRPRILKKLKYWRDFLKGKQNY